MARTNWKDFLIEIFAWWRGNTWGTRLALRGFAPIGTDEFGNTYYQEKKGHRRWVIYSGGYADPSSIPPAWHSWMHYRTDVPPTEEDYVAKPWQKPHQKNMTGTAQAYRPEGSLLRSGERPRVSADYDAWSPE
jgi:NADH:ubiquinone oxidoreductase subunit